MDERTVGPAPAPDPGEDGVRRRYDWTETPPSTAVVETAAEAAGVDPTTIEPLYDALDPDGLDALVGAATPGGCRSGVAVAFTAADHRISVHGTGEVVVRPAD